MFERYIFDIDGTLLFANWEKEKLFFEQELGKNAKEFHENVFKLLEKYEILYRSYDIDLLSSHLRKSGIEVSPSFIQKWIEFNSTNLDDVINEDAFMVLEYLKKKDKKLSILTNWFSKTQIKRLEQAGILEYFDTIVCGDEVLKPNRNSYIKAANGTDLDDCIMIGDNYLKDYLSPKFVGMNAFLVDDKNKLGKVKTLGGNRNGFK